MRPVDFHHAHSLNDSSLSDFSYQHHKIGQQHGQLHFSTITTMRLLRVLSLTLLLCALCVRAEEEKIEENVEEKEQDSSEEETEPEKPEKTEEITEEKDVLVLHSVNFDRALSENKYLLVEFCKYFIYVLRNPVNAITLFIDHFDDYK